MLKFCVLGSGISYSLSPIIHKTVFAALGVDADYFVEDIPQGDLRLRIKSLKEDYDGFNVTKPFKQEIILYLDEVYGKVDAVNTVSRSGGRHRGENTDMCGFIDSARELTGEMTGLKTVVLGAGGAAEAVVCGLAEAGADVTVVNRTPERAHALAAKYGAASAASPVGLRPEFLVNCTSVGNDGASPVPEGLDLTNLRFAYDLVYSPAHTSFMKVCEDESAKTACGLGMLIYQAIAADEIFLDKRGQLDKQALYAEVKKVLSDKI